MTQSEQTISVFLAGCAVSGGAVLVRMWAKQQSHGERIERLESGQRESTTLFQDLIGKVERILGILEGRQK